MKRSAIESVVEVDEKPKKSQLRLKKSVINADHQNKHHHHHRRGHHKKRKKGIGNTANLSDKDKALLEVNAAMVTEAEEPFPLEETFPLEEAFEEILPEEDKAYQLRQKSSFVSQLEVDDIKHTDEYMKEESSSTGSDSGPIQVFTMSFNSDDLEMYTQGIAGSSLWPGKNGSRTSATSRLRARESDQRQGSSGSNRLRAKESDLRQWSSASNRLKTIGSARPSSAEWRKSDSSNSAGQPDDSESESSESSNEKIHKHKSRRKRRHGARRKSHRKRSSRKKPGHDSHESLPKKPIAAWGASSEGGAGRSKSKRHSHSPSREHDTERGKHHDAERGKHHDTERSKHHDTERGRHHDTERGRHHDPHPHVPKVPKGHHKRQPADPYYAFLKDHHALGAKPTVHEASSKKVAHKDSPDSESEHVHKRKVPTFNVPKKSHTKHEEEPAAGPSKWIAPDFKQKIVKPFRIPGSDRIPDLEHMAPVEHEEPHHSRHHQKSHHKTKKKKKKKDPRDEEDEAMYFTRDAFFNMDPDTPDDNMDVKHPDSQLRDLNVAGLDVKHDGNAVENMQTDVSSQTLANNSQLSLNQSKNNRQDYIGNYYFHFSQVDKSESYS